MAAALAALAAAANLLNALGFPSVGVVADLADLAAAASLLNALGFAAVSVDSVALFVDAVLDAVALSDETVLSDAADATGVYSLLFDSLH